MTRRPLVAEDDPALRAALHRALDAVAAGYPGLGYTAETLARQHDAIHQRRPVPPSAAVGSSDWVDAQAQLHVRTERLKSWFDEALDQGPPDAQL